MRGLNEVKFDVVNRRLQLAKESLKEVITVIVGKFVELQKVNPMLAVEALFRYQSREIKDSIMQNYSNQQQAQVHAVEERMIFEDEEELP